jgi:hypothetical protein
MYLLVLFKCIGRLHFLAFMHDYYFSPFERSHCAFTQILRRENKEETPKIWQQHHSIWYYCYVCGPDSRSMRGWQGSCRPLRAVSEVMKWWPRLRFWQRPWVFFPLRVSHVKSVRSCSQFFFFLCVTWLFSGYSLLNNYYAYTWVTSVFYSSTVQIIWKLNQGFNSGTWLYSSMYFSNLGLTVELNSYLRTRICFWS